MSKLLQKLTNTENELAESNTQLQNAKALSTKLAKEVADQTAEHAFELKSLKEKLQEVEEQLNTTKSTLVDEQTLSQKLIKEVSALQST